MKNKLREKLAEIEHNQWMYWAKAILQTEAISKERQERWKNLFVPYKELSEVEKEQDRMWAVKVLKVIDEEMGAK